MTVKTPRKNIDRSAAVIKLLGHLHLLFFRVWCFITILDGIEIDARIGVVSSLKNEEFSMLMIGCCPKGGRRKGALYK
ncbi:ORF1069 [White spot syndrome virus]|uniref:ORF1069 n=1 Tax=White spot syndrome virus TaxID=342409 RepID=A0A2D3I646_9VIRU|nr:ORF1069 [White spot syndrome virus]